MLNRHFPFIRRIVLRGATLLIPVLVFVAGCAGMHGSSNSASLASTVPAIRIPNLAQESQILTFIVSAPDAGRTGLIKVPGEAAPVRVRVERIYESASGYACRRYHLSSAEGPPSRSSHLACRGTDGRWFQPRLLVNPDVLNGSGSSTLRVGGS